MVTSLIIAVLCAVLIVVGGLIIKKRLTGDQKDHLLRLIEEIKEINRQIDSLQSKSADLISKGQEESAREQLDTAKASLAAEKDNLKEIERKLDSSQKLVEQKEAIQQDLKSGKLEDEQKMAELMASFEDITAESVTLEQQLANSMKNLDQILAEVQLTNDQKAVLQDLSGALTSSGARLRDLIMEYQTSNERLQALQSQHQDLEEEYTRLVEQQLGD